MKKLLIGLLAVGSVSSFAFAEKIIQLPKQDEGIFEEARKITTRSEAQQKIDLAKLYDRYKLDVSNTYAVVDLNYVTTRELGYEVVCYIIQGSRKATLKSDGGVQNEHKPTSNYWTNNFVSYKKDNRKAVLLQEIDVNDVNRFRVTSVCRGDYRDIGSFEAADMRKVVDALIITKDAVIEKIDFYANERGVRPSKQFSASMMLEYKLNNLSVTN